MIINYSGLVYNPICVARLCKR